MIQTKFYIPSGTYLRTNPSMDDFHMIGLPTGWRPYQNPIPPRYTLKFAKPRDLAIAYVNAPGALKSNRLPYNMVAFSKSFTSKVYECIESALLTELTERYHRYSDGVCDVKADAAGLFTSMIFGSEQSYPDLKEYCEYSMSEDSIVSAQISSLGLWRNLPLALNLTIRHEEFLCV